MSNSDITIGGNLIKWYGFYNPPVGIVHILNLLYLPSDAVFYIIDPLLNQELPYHEICQQSNPYVIISTHEGASHRWFDELIPRLQDLGMKNDHIILRSACLWDPDSPIKNIHTIVDECTDFNSQLQQVEPNTTAPKHNFVCLNRGHRWQRYQLVKSIFDRGLDRFGRLTYIELPDNPDQRFFTITKQDIDWNQQRSMTDSQLTDAMFNVICETAFEPDPNSLQLVHHHRPGITEKTYKCFALLQIPIWLAPYRAVECYRRLGFDVFDDIVDHSYDLEVDPSKRIDMVINQLQKICNLNIAQLAQLKIDLMPRLQRNFRTLDDHAHNLNTELPQWQALFSRN